MTITGTNLLDATVDFGTSPATIVPGSDTATSIEVTSPNGQRHGERDGHDRGRRLGHLRERQVHVSEGHARCC